jgi:high-affinity nickel-transport protein
MQDLPTDWAALCGVVFLLGLRHGLDADHLAAIDGLTRVASARGGGRLHPRLCGALFSLGHGAVVLAIAGGVGLLGSRWTPPGWFELLGALVSIGFLTLLGVVNLAAVLRTPAHEPVALVGVRGRAVAWLLGRAGGARGPAAVLGVGGLFALSFDTLSQAALFAVVSVRFGGAGHALALGALFVLGMLLADGANGWWMAHLLRRTDRAAAVASRTMTLAVAGVSLAVAAFGLARLVSGPVARWSDGRELGVGLGVLAAVAAGYGLALALGRRALRPG